MAREGIILGPKRMARVMAAVGQVEAQPATRAPGPDVPGALNRGFMAFIKPTGPAGSDGAPHPNWYPGRVQHFIGHTNSKEDLGEVWLFDWNDQQLSEEVAYRAQPVYRHAASNKLVFAAGVSQAGERVIVKIWQKAGAMGPLTSCSGSGATGSGEAEPCLSWMHIGLLQTWDRECDRWIDGACVRVIDLEGQPLVEGRRYFAQRLSDDWPEGPTAFTYPIDGPCNSYVQTSPVYGVNAGNPVRQIFIEAELGVYCPSGSGSGEGADDECVICNSDTLHIFEGNIQEFDVDTCTWKNTMKERVYVAATCGKKLWVGMRFNAVYHSIIPPIKGERDDEDDDGPPILEGSGGIHGRECQALYIVECRGLHGSFTSLTASGSTISEYYDTYVCGELICRDGPFPLGTCDCISGGGGGGGGGGIGGGVTSCCPNEIPATLHVSITGDATASGTITWNGSNCWLGTLTLCGQEVSVQFCCTGASCNGFIISIAGFANTGLCGGCSCDPLSFCTNMTTFSGLGSCPPGSSISVLVTE